MCIVTFSRSATYSALEKIRNDGLPRWAYVAICNTCSHKCPWCYGAFNQNLSGIMSLENFRTLLEKFAGIGIIQVTLSGGEPTEHPQFSEMVSVTQEAGFLTHVTCHGGNFDVSLADHLAASGVKQVQLNFQGKKRHDSVHGVLGSFDAQTRAIQLLLERNIEVTASVTAARYNAADVPEIFREAAALGVDRLRVWDATGRGSHLARGIDVVELFTSARAAAAELGFTHCLSYDPLFEGDVWVPCVQLQNLFMYITTEGMLRLCGAVPGGPELNYIDCLSASGDEILAVYLERNRVFLDGRESRCPAHPDTDELVPRPRSNDP